VARVPTKTSLFGSTEYGGPLFRRFGERRTFRQVRFCALGESRLAHQQVFLCETHFLRAANSFSIAGTGADLGAVLSEVNEDRRVIAGIYTIPSPPAGGCPGRRPSASLPLHALVVEGTQVQAGVPVSGFMIRKASFAGSQSRLLPSLSPGNFVKPL